MTREEQESRMAELLVTAEAKVLEYNDAYQNGDFIKSTELDDEITQCVNEYTSIAKGICYDECLAAEDPMLEAVKRLTYQTIAKKDSKIGDDKIPVREIVSKDKQIDILELSKKKKGGIGHNPRWNSMIEKFNLLLTVQKAEDLGIDPRGIRDSYAMADISKAIDLGKNPVSKTNLLKTLTSIVQAMIGEEYKPVSHDVNYLLSVYSKKGKVALQVSCANHKYLRGYLMEICHKMVTGEAYSLDYKKVEAKQ